MILALLGPDGCGKSSVIDALTQKVSEEKRFQGVSVFHMRPHLIFPKKGSDYPTVTVPHGKPNRTALVSLLKLLTFWLDYLLGYWLVVKPAARAGKLVIFDRYYEDFWVDPLRFRFGAPLGCVKAMMPLIPRPDVTVLLDAPASVLQQRKQEVSLEESERQRNAYLQLVKEHVDQQVLDASQPLEQVVSQLWQAIVGERKEMPLETVLSKLFPPGSAWCLTKPFEKNGQRFEVIQGQEGWPRWVLPNDPGIAARLDARFLATWTPSQPLSKAAWWLLRTVYRLGGLSMLACVPALTGVRSVWVSLPADGEASDGWRQWQHLGWQKPTAPVPVCYVGTPSAIGKLVVALCEEADEPSAVLTSIQNKCSLPPSLTLPREGGGNAPKSKKQFKIPLNVSAIAKIPVGARAAQNIQNEAQLLIQARERYPDTTPAVLYVDNASGVCLQSVVFGKATGRDFTEAHCQWLLGLRQQESIDLSTVCASIQARLETAVRNQKECSLPGLLDCLKVVGNESLPAVPAVMLHGDFAPWNIQLSLLTAGVRTESPLIVLDWEEGSILGLPLWDVIHFFAMPLYLLKKSTLLQALPTTLWQHPQVIAYAEALGIPCERLCDIGNRVLILYGVDYVLRRLEEGNPVHAARFLAAFQPVMETAETLVRRA